MSYENSFVPLTYTHLSIEGCLRASMWWTHLYHYKTNQRYAGQTSSPSSTTVPPNLSPVNMDHHPNTSQRQRKYSLIKHIFKMLNCIIRVKMTIAETEGSHSVRSGSGLADREHHLPGGPGWFLAREGRCSVVAQYVMPAVPGLPALAAHSQTAAWLMT